MHQPNHAAMTALLKHRNRVLDLESRVEELGGAAAVRAAQHDAQTSMLSYEQALVAQLELRLYGGVQ